MIIGPYPPHHGQASGARPSGRTPGRGGPLDPQPAARANRRGSASRFDGTRPRQRSAGRALLAALAGWLITAAALAQPPADTEIARAVTDRLIREPSVDAHRIDVAVTDGIVDLTGTIDNILAKERAARVSETVTGVRAVVNRIEVAADERSDEALRTAIETALTKNPATEAFEIDVRADRGEVTLEGPVDSWQERRLAARVAEGVDGVHALTNRLVVRPPETRDDAQIEAEVEQALRWDSRIDDAGIEVEVEGGEVRLTGTVRGPSRCGDRRRRAPGPRP